MTGLFDVIGAVLQRPLQREYLEVTALRRRRKMRFVSTYVLIAGITSVILTHIKTAVSLPDELFTKVENKGEATWCFS